MEALRAKLDAQMMDMDEDELYEAKPEANAPCAEEPASTNLTQPQYLKRRTLNSDNDFTEMMDTPKSVGPILDAFSIPDNMNDDEKAELAQLLQQIQTMELERNPQLFYGLMHYSFLKRFYYLPPSLHMSQASGKSASECH